MQMEREKGIKMPLVPKWCPGLVGANEESSQYTLEGQKRQNLNEAVKGWLLGRKNSWHHWQQ